MDFIKCLIYIFKPWMEMFYLIIHSTGQVRSGQSVVRAHSEQAVVVHACHGHRYT